MMNRPQVVLRAVFYSSGISNTAIAAAAESGAD